MEKAMFGLLLALTCSLSTAQLQGESDVPIIQHGEQAESQRIEPRHQQACEPDIHTVLREMSASLAAQTVEIQHLQRQNEVQAAKIGDLEAQKAEVDKLKLQVQGQAAKLGDLEAQKVEVDKLKQQVQVQTEKLREMDQLKQQLQVQADKLREMEMQTVDTMKQQLQAHAEELFTINLRSNVTENQVDALRRDREVKQVAFSASLMVSEAVTLGPYNTDVPLVFRYVVTNTGNAYNPNTGFFTAPVKGAYHFEFHIGAHGHASHASATRLIKNGQLIFSTLDHRPSHYGSSSNGATLILEVGDVVFVRLVSNTRIYDSGSHYSTFSGHLLFTM